MSKSTNIVADYDALPDWFTCSLTRRESEGKDFEVAHEGRRWVTDGAMAIAVSGSTWALDGRLSLLFRGEDVVDPLVRLTPGAPVFSSRSCEGCSDEVIAASGALAQFDVPMGAHDVRLLLARYALVVQAFGDDLEWFGGGPNDPVLAKRGGVLVAIVMPVYGPDDDAIRAGVFAALEMREARRDANE